MSAIAPGPKGHWLLGSLPDLRRDPLAFFRDLQRQYGDVVRFSFGHQVAHLISSPSGVRHVLTAKAGQYTKNTPGIRKLKAILGEGLLTSDGPFWLRQRRIAQPAFQHERIRDFGELISRHSRALVERWAQRPPSAPPIDVHSEMMALTLAIAGEALFGADVTADAPAVAQAIDTLLLVQDARFSRPFTIPLWAPTPENLRFHRALAALDDVCLRMIAARRRSASGRTDLLSLLMTARDPETGEAMSDAQLRDEVVTLLVAGHETTANVLTFALHLLARHEAEQSRLRSALSESYGREFSCLDVHRFAPVARVIDEAMRLYPPGWLFARAPSTDDVIDGFAIPAHSYVFISAFLVHRLPAHWEEPEAFRPSRFDGPKPERGVYFPFGMGQRQCIGAGLAELEMHDITSRIVSRFVLDTSLEGSPPLDPKVTLRPRCTVPLTLRQAQGPTK